MNRVHLYPGTNPGKALISTAFEPVQEFISFSHEATGSGEHIVHIDGANEGSLSAISVGIAGIAFAATRYLPR